MRNEVQTVSSTTISNCTTTVTVTVTSGRPAVDIVVSRVALGMLRWSERRAGRAAARASRAAMDDASTDRVDFRTTFRSAHERAIDAGHFARFF